MTKLYSSLFAKKKPTKKAIHQFSPRIADTVIWARLLKYASRKLRGPFSDRFKPTAFVIITETSFNYTSILHIVYTVHGTCILCTRFKERKKKYGRDSISRLIYISFLVKQPRSAIILPTRYVISNSFVFVTKISFDTPYVDVATTKPPPRSIKKHH